MKTHFLPFNKTLRTTNQKKLKEKYSIKRKCKRTQRGNCKKAHFSNVKPIQIQNDVVNTYVDVILYAINTLNAALQFCNCYISQVASSLIILIKIMLLFLTPSYSVIHEWRDLQFKDNYEQQILEKLFHGNFILLSKFSPFGCWEEITERKFLSYFILLVETRVKTRAPTSTLATRLWRLHFVLFIHTYMHTYVNGH